ncbi:MAG: hypothetical protein AAF682_30455 [Planctomycetota bacterium]
MAAYSWNKIRAIARRPRRGRARPIGTLAKAQSVQATLVGVGARGRFEFVEEVDVEVVLGEEREVRVAGYPPEAWRSFVVRTKDRAAHGNHAVVASFPYLTDWFSHAPFRRPKKRSRAEIDGRLSGAIEDARPTREVLSEKSWEPFEHTPSVFTATLDDPHRPSGGRIGGGRLGRRRVVRGEREQLCHESWVFGIVPDVEAVEAEVAASPELDRLLALTEERRLFEETHIEGLAPRGVEMDPEIAAKGRDALRAAVRCALAGPCDGLSTGAWQRGMAVVDLVARIYVQLLFSLQETREKARDRSLRRRSAGQMPRQVSQFRAWVRLGIEELCAAPDAAEGQADAVAALLAADEPEQRAGAIAMATALLANGAVLAGVGERLAQLEDTDPDADVRRIAAWARGWIREGF